MQLAEVRSPLLRVLEALVGFVDAHGPLHGHALGGGALGRETVGVRLALQVFPALVQRGAVLRELPRNAKQFEVVGLQVHGEKKPPAR